jgi:DNA-binding response OmpR family regulator
VRLLIVEDDPGVRRLVSNHLEQQPGLTVTGAGTVAEALVAVRHSAFDAVILDLSLPDGSGLEVLSAVRQLGSTAHVIILSGAGSEIDRVRALDLGADDYVVKPFSARELTARILAVRRRADIGRDTQLQYGPISIDLMAREVNVGGAPLGLTAKEFDLLAFLAAAPGTHSAGTSSSGRCGSRPPTGSGSPR